MSFGPAILAAIGGYGRGRAAKADAAQKHSEFEEQEKQSQEQIDEQKTRDASQAAYETAQTQAEKQNALIAARQAGYTVNPDGSLAPLPVMQTPKNLQQIIPNQNQYGKGKPLGMLPVPGTPEYSALKAEHYQNLATMYEMGDPSKGIPPDTARAAFFRQQASDSALDAQRVATAGRTAYDAQNLDPARVGEIQAQTARIKQLHGEVEQRFATELQGKSMEVQARMNAARISARRAYQGNNNDERETIALMAGLAAASGRDSTQAFQVANEQYKAEMATWQKSQENYSLGIGPSPGPEPVFNINVPGAQPSAPTIMFMQGPDGRAIPYVDPRGGGGNGGNGGGGGGDRLSKLRTLVTNARAAGASDAVIRASTLPAGTTQADLDAIGVKRAPKPLPVFHRVQPTPINGIMPQFLPVR